MKPSMKHKKLRKHKKLSNTVVKSIKYNEKYFVLTPINVDSIRELEDHYRLKIRGRKKKNKNDVIQIHVRATKVNEKY